MGSFLVNFYIFSGLFIMKEGELRMSNSSIKDDSYKLTAAEKKLFEVLVNPEHTGKTVQELCNLATISRNKYYQAMKKDGFVKLVNDTTMDLIKGKAADVLNATYKYAMTAKGHQDRKMLLTIADIYKDKQEVEHSGTVEISNTAKEIENFFNGSDSK